jgi:hypothetical protein
MDESAGLAGDVDDLIERFAGAGVGVLGHSFQRATCACRKKQRSIRHL